MPILKGMADIIEGHRGKTNKPVVIAFSEISKLHVPAGASVTYRHMGGHGGWIVDNAARYDNGGLCAHDLTYRWPFVSSEDVTPIDENSRAANQFPAGVPGGILLSSSRKPYGS